MAIKDAPSVSATKIAQHLGLSRTFVERLAGEGVLPRRPDGKFEIDATRLAYLRHLRQARRHSPATAARAALDAARAREVEVRNAQREKVLIAYEEHLEIVDDMAGVVRTALSSLPARASRDLTIRRRIEAAVRDTLQEIADIAGRRARACGQD
jgi:phage terminase Nu1 subunit (DNA packaging protein)